MTIQMWVLTFSGSINSVDGAEIPLEIVIGSSPQELDIAECNHEVKR